MLHTGVVAAWILLVLLSLVRGFRTALGAEHAQHKSFHLRAGSSAQEHVADVQKNAFRGLDLSGLHVEASNLEQLMRETLSQKLLGSEDVWEAAFVQLL